MVATAAVVVDASADDVAVLVVVGAAASDVSSRLKQPSQQDHH